MVVKHHPNKPLLAGTLARETVSQAWTAGHTEKYILSGGRFVPCPCL